MSQILIGSETNVKKTNGNYDNLMFIWNDGNRLQFRRQYRINRSRFNRFLYRENFHGNNKSCQTGYDQVAV